MIGEGRESFLGDRIYGVGSRQRLDVERVRRIGVLGPGAGPEEALRPGAGGRERAPARRRQHATVLPVGASGDRDAEAIAERRRHRVVHRHVPAADEERGDGIDPWIEARRDPPFDAPHVGFGRRDVLRRGEQQRHVDRHAAEDRLLDGRNAFGRAWNLDEQIGTLGSAVQLDRRLYGAGGIVGQERRDLQRHPAVHAAGAVVDGAKEVGGARQVLDGELEEQRLS